MVTFKKVTYELPEKDDLRVKVVQALPKDWQALNARLFAPERLYQGGQVAFNTGLFLNSHAVNGIWLIGEYALPWGEVSRDDLRDYNRKGIKPGILDMFIRDKQPSVLNLKYVVGEKEDPISFVAEATDLVSHFVGMGYRGWIETYSDSVHTDSSVMFGHPIIEIDHALSFVRLRFPDEKTKNKKLGNFLGTIRKLRLENRI